MRKFLAALLVGLLMVPLCANAAGLTLTQKEKYNFGGLKVTTLRALFDDSYATGGEALADTTLGMYNVLWVICTVDTAGAGNYDVGYDDINNKLFVNAIEDTITIPATTLADTLDASPAEDVLTIFVPAITTTVTPEEVDNGTDLSSLRVRIMAFGH